MKWKTIRVVGLILVVAAPASALAQGTPIVKKAQIGASGIYIGSVLTPWTPSTLIENDKISGTRIEVACALTVTGSTLPAGIKSKDFKIQLMSGSTSLTVVDFPNEVDGYGTSKKFRFATTFASDGQEIDIRVTAKFWMQPPGYNEPAWFASDQSYTFLAYNKLQLLGTNIDRLGQESQTFINVSDRLTETASDLLEPSHTSIPSSGEPARSESKSAILAKTTLSTALAFITHADHTAFNDPYGTDVIAFNDQSSSCVASKVVDKVSARIPFHNIVGFWACETLANSATTAPSSYGISSNTINAAYIGFDIPPSLRQFIYAVWYEYNNGAGPIPQEETENSDISFHSESFFDHLMQGHVASKALEVANATEKPGKWTSLPGGNYQVFEHQPMILRGDPLATLKYVYLTAGERTALDLTTDDIYDLYFYVMN